MAAEETRLRVSKLCYKSILSLRLASHICAQRPDRTVYSLMFWASSACWRSRTAVVLLWCDTPIAILRSKRQASSEDCLNANQRPRSAPQPKHSLFAPRIGSGPSHWIIFQAPQRKVHALAASWRLQCISGPQSTVHEAGRREVSCTGQGDICRDRLPSERHDRLQHRSNLIPACVSLAVRCALHPVRS